MFAFRRESLISDRDCLESLEGGAYGIRRVVFGKKRGVALYAMVVTVLRFCLFIYVRLHAWRGQICT